MINFDWGKACLLAGVEPKFIHQGATSPVKEKFPEWGNKLTKQSRTQAAWEALWKLIMLPLKWLRRRLYRPPSLLSSVTANLQ